MPLATHFDKPGNRVHVGTDVVTDSELALYLPCLEGDHPELVDLRQATLKATRRGIQALAAGLRDSGRRWAFASGRTADFGFLRMLEILCNFQAESICRAFRTVEESKQWLAELRTRQSETPAADGTVSERLGAAEDRTT